MPTIRYTGRVVPPAFDLTISPIPKILIQNHPTLGDVTIQADIKTNKVTVDCELNKFDEKKDFIALYQVAYDLARASVDLFGFSKGCGLSIELERIRYPDGGEQGILPGGLELGELATATANGEPDFAKILKFLLYEPTLIQALRDLVEAIKLPRPGPVNSARAIEGIRHLLAPNEKDRKNAWAKVGKDLNISSAYLRDITDQSIGPRHADPTHIPGADVQRTTIKAWTIMNRYLEYRKRGCQPLPSSEFPLL